MEIVGHLCSAELSGIHQPHELYGEQAIETMMPNFLHCHDWAYQSAWHADAAPASRAAPLRRIRSHIVADWLIHYGSADTTRKRKCGWAYRRMRTAKIAARTFFAEAVAHDMLERSAVLPPAWSKKQSLDFNHSILEYALDLLWADRHFDAERTRDLAASIARLDDPHVRRRYMALFGSLGAWSDHDAAFLDASVDDAVRDAVSARHATDFAVFTTARKYGFKMEPAAIAHCRRLLERVAADIAADDAAQVLTETASAIADPALIFTGPLAPNGAAPAA